MSITALDSPLRLTWHLHNAAGHPLDPAVAGSIAQRIVEAGIFYLTLDAQPLAHRSLPQILPLLRQGGIRVQATFCGTEAEWQGLVDFPADCDLLLDAGAFLCADPTSTLSRLSDAVRQLQGRGIKPALLLVPNRANLLRIPQLLDLCRTQGITRFKLPNTPIDASFGADFPGLLLPGPSDLDALRSAVSDPVSLRSGVELEVHDLFLWEIFFPAARGEGRAEYGGCQAGNSLGHVDSNGTVHPCSSWPQPLGSLLETSLDEIWQGTLRQQVRAEVATTPAGCGGCRDYAICFGGCRGLSRSLAPTGDGRDLLCRERR